MQENGGDGNYWFCLWHMCQNEEDREKINNTEDRIRFRR